MIKEISIENFKLHKKTSITTTPITIFIGPNNSGKSSIFQALQSLRQAKAWGSPGSFITASTRREASLPGSFIYQPNIFLDLGEFRDVVRQGEDKITIGLHGEVFPPKPVKNVTQIEAQFEVHIQNNSLFFHKGSLNASGQYKIIWEWTRDNFTINPPSIQIDEFNISLSPKDSFQLLGSSSMSHPSNISPEKVAEIYNLKYLLDESTARLIDSVHLIYPLRGFEESAYLLSDSAPGNLEMALLPDRSIALTSILAYNRDMEEKLSQWLKEMAGIEIRTHLVPSKKVIIQTKKDETEKMKTLFINEGSGVSQLPFILLPIALTPQKETIIIAEPEVHLHPKAQADLASLFLKVMKKENKQFFIETHSEHILHSFLYAVAKGEILKDRLSIYYFENIDGVSQVRPLEIDNKGRVAGGLPGFFEHSLSELSEYLDAITKR